MATTDIIAPATVAPAVTPELTLAREILAALTEAESAAAYISDSAVRDELLRNIGGLQAQMRNGITTVDLHALRQAPLSVRSEVTGRATQEFSSNSSRAILQEIALDEAQRARVELRMQRITSENLDAYLDSFHDPEASAWERNYYNTLSRQMLDSPGGRALLENYNDLPEPEKRRALEEQEVRERLLRDIARDDSQSPERRAFAQQLLNTRSYLLPESNGLIHDFAEGKPLEELRPQAAALNESSVQATAAMLGQIPIPAAQKQAFLETLDPEQRALAESGNEGYARVLIDVAGGQSRRDIRGAMQAFEAAGGDLEKLTPQQRQIVTAQTQMNIITPALAMGATIQRVGELVQLRDRGTGAELTEAQREQLGMLGTVTDTTQNFSQRVDALMNLMDDGAIPPLANNPGQNRLLSALTLNFIDRQPGPNQMADFLANMQSQNPEYIQAYQNFIGRSIANQDLDMQNPADVVRFSNALNRASWSMGHGTTITLDENKQLLFNVVSRGSDTTETRNSFFNSVSDAMVYKNTQRAVGVGADAIARGDSASITNAATNVGGGVTRVLANTGVDETVARRAGTASEVALDGAGHILSGDARGAAAAADRTERGVSRSLQASGVDRENAERLAAAVGVTAKAAGVTGAVVVNSARETADRASETWAARDGFGRELRDHLGAFSGNANLRRYFDKDGDGKVELHELRDKLKALGVDGFSDVGNGDRDITRAEIMSTVATAITEQNRRR